MFCFFSVFFFNNAGNYYFFYSVYLPCIHLHVFSFVSSRVLISTSSRLNHFFLSSHSGCSDSGQSSGTDPYKAAGSETVVQGADQLHSLGGAVGGLAVSVAGPGADPLTGRALLGHVLVQL